MKKKQPNNVSRRGLLKALGLGLAGTHISSQALAKLNLQQNQSQSDQQPQCDTGQDIRDVEFPLEDNENVHFWMDGRNSDGSFGSAIQNRANLAVFINFTQTASRFIDKVVLTTHDRKPLGVRYYSYADKTSQGKLPYVMFDSLNLQKDKVHYIFYQVRQGDKTEVFRTPIPDRSNTILRAPFMPQTIIDNLAALRDGAGSQITTPFIHQSPLDVANHSVRFKINSIQQNGNFEINVELMHADVDASHFPRYFLITDPVGHLLGGVERAFQQTPDIAAAGDSAGWMTIRSLQTSNTLNANFTSIPSIADCPLIHIFTDNAYDCLAKATVRLR